MGPESLKPTWEYLRNASITTLFSFEISRLNHAANLKKEIDSLINQWLDEASAALLARFLIEQASLEPNILRPRPRTMLAMQRLPPGAHRLVRRPKKDATL